MTLKTWLLLGVELLLSGIIIFVLLGQVSEQRGRAEKAEQEVDGQRQVIATQAFNINRFNQIADYTNRNNSLIDASSDNTVIEYREILRREKTCDLPVPADIAGGLLEYAHRLRSSAMHADTDGPDAADDRTAATSSITYCQAVLWIKPLLAVIEKGNNNFAGIRQIEQERR